MNKAEVSQNNEGLNINPDASGQIQQGGTASLVISGTEQTK
jgi:hypothetical protein